MSNLMNAHYLHTATKSGKRVTLAALEFTDKSWHVGAAKCNPKDQYNKKFGRRIAEGRALKNPLVVYPPTDQSLITKLLKAEALELDNKQFSFIKLSE